MTELMPIALERQNLHGAATAARRVIDIGRPWLRFLGWWREPAVPFLYRDQLDRYVTWMRDERGFTPSTVEQWGRTTRRFLRWCAETGRQLGESDGGRHRQLCRHPGKGPLDARLDSQHGLGIARVLALRRQRGVVLEPIGRVDFPASALSAGVCCHMPRIGLPSSKCWPTSTRTSHGISAIAPSSCCSPSTACGAVKLLLCGSTRSIGRGERSDSFG